MQSTITSLLGKVFPFYKSLCTHPAEHREVPNFLPFLIFLRTASVRRTTKVGKCPHWGLAPMTSGRGVFVHNHTSRWLIHWLARNAFFHPLLARISKKQWQFGYDRSILQETLTQEFQWRSHLASQMPRFKSSRQISKMGVTMELSSDHRVYRCRWLGLSPLRKEWWAEALVFIQDR